MEKQEFVDKWIIAFLAAWTANHYADVFVTDNEQRLNNPPIEDAEFLAEKQWLKFKKDRRI